MSIAGTEITRQRLEALGFKGIGSFEGVGSESNSAIRAYMYEQPIKRVRLTFDDLAVTMADEAGVVAHGGEKIFDLAPGVHAVAALADLTITKSGAGIDPDWNGDFGVGTVVASNNNSLSATEQNIIPSTATPAGVSGVSTAKGASTGFTFLDGTSAATDIYLNFLIDDGDQDGGGALIVRGTIDLFIICLGDH